MKSAFEDYIMAIQEKGLGGSELDYRTPLENLLYAIKPEKTKAQTDITIVHEPKAIDFAGKPDFLIRSNNLNIGYIETKKLDADLAVIRKSEQIKKYLRVSRNLLLTNYREFLLIKDDVDSETVTLFTLQDFENKKIKLKDEVIARMELLFESFFSAAPAEIATVTTLAEELANRGKILKEFIKIEIIQNQGDYAGWLKALYDEFRKTLIADLTEEGFADACTQTLIYGLLLAGIDKKNPIARASAYNCIPKSFSVIYELFKFFSTNEPPANFAWIYDEIIDVMNSINHISISKELMFTSEHEEQDDFDPYYYFYEPFLQRIDALQKKEKGVYYTPIPIVSFIIRSLDSILKKHFNVQGGFLNEQVTTLDFACGTGTFLAEIFKLILRKLKSANDEGQTKSIIKNHILKNFYGFEYLVAPYAIAHLKLKSLLNELSGGFEFEDNERLQVYLTDTLNDSPRTPNALFQAMSREGQEANRIKKSDKILVITGNPPYNVKSKNTSDWLDKNILLYKPEGEKKLNLDDDYIKFIRFAHFKIAQNNKGVVGIITNNSFLNGITHRKMRAELLSEFDEIYILNLHGSSRFAEITPEGQKDENVFDIMQGVCISIFVKTTNRKSDGSIFYLDLWGKREQKFQFLRNNEMKTVCWQKLDFKEFDNEFKKTRWGKRFPYFKFFVPKESAKLIKNYGNSWGMSDIFKIIGSGVKTDRDDMLVDFDAKTLGTRMQKGFSGDFDEEFVKKFKIHNSSSYQFKDKIRTQRFSKKAMQKYHYRPFDFRWVYYKIRFTSRPGAEVFEHIITHNNYGIAFPRNDYGTNEMNHFLPVKILSDIHFVGGQSYIAPLYLYNNNHNKNGNGNGFWEEITDRKPNFKPEFSEFISKKYKKKPTPEEIFGYIYAVLYCPTFREKYLELLKIDFPRVPFVDDEKLFFKVAETGWELVQHHLFEKNYEKNICYYPIKRKEDSDLVEAVNKPAKAEKQGMLRIWINKEQYFDNVPEHCWDFCVGGYQVLEHWLKDRKGRILTNEDINTFKQIVNILDFTIAQMSKIETLLKDFLF